ncbi:PaaI family thioesterase [uncultured Roseobacter sp.]|uniref:PaaI family thioesterase n=1 Tax=uncultured Roseobacter sp. TaxID=114847 RepID=UPI002619FA31|nr:PaaI family thioesterase [uncultured Roseobacter sp.]
MPSPPPDFPISGAQGLIGYRVEVDRTTRRAEVVLDIAVPHLNRNESLHGGIIAMMLDSAAGFAASLHFGGDELARVVTVSLTTQFVAAVREGRVVAKGTISGGGRKIVCADAELHDAAGTLIAKASGVFKRVS